MQYFKVHQVYLQLNVWECFEWHLPKRVNFQFSPIDKQWRGRKIDLTLGHQYKNLRYTYIL